MGLEFVRSRPVLTANSRLVACAASSSDWELQLDINILIFSLDPTRACGAYTCMRRLCRPRQAQRPWHGPGWRRAISISSKEQEHKILTRLPDAKILPCNIFGAGVILHR